MKKLAKRTLRPYHLKLGCVEAYSPSGDSDTTYVAQSLDRVTVTTQGDSVRVDSVDVRRGIIEADGDTTWTDTSRVAVATDRQGVKDAAPFGTKTIVGRIFDGIMEWLRGDEELDT